MTEKREEPVLRKNLIITPIIPFSICYPAPQHLLYFLPLPQGQDLLRPTGLLRPKSLFFFIRFAKFDQKTISRRENGHIISLKL